MSRERTVGPWRVTNEQSAFSNPWIDVVDHTVIHPDGAPGEYGVVHFKNLAIGILPFGENGMVTLVGQHRFPHDKYSWELPEGGGALGLDPLVSAQRELAEETGLIARDWAPLCEFDVSNSVTDERAVCFFAWELSAGQAAPESSEALTLKQLRFSELLELVISGAITDSLTIVMVLTAYAKALRGEAPAPISAHILASVPRK